jgi:hypothetical protein
LNPAACRIPDQWRRRPWRTIPTIPRFGGARPIRREASCSAPLPGFPHGLLVMMNSGARNFLFYRWQQIVR